MIPRPSLLEWQKKTQWPSMTQVEQDLILSRIIVEIYTNPLLREHLVFRGGTALHKLFLSPAGRYSEDVDLVQIHAGPIGPLLEELRKTLSSWLGKPKWKLSEGRATLYYRFTPEEAPAQTMRVKVEINTWEHFHHLGLFEIPYEIENPWFSGEASIRTYALEELIGTKLRALYQRKKGRDLFDLYTILQHHPNLNCSQVIDCFNFYMKRESQAISKAEFQMNMAQKRQDAIFLNDIVPLLRAEHNYNHEEAHHVVETELIQRLEGDPWKALEKVS